MIRIIVTGNGKSGSWKIRGEQLGTAIGAHVTPGVHPVAPGQIVVFVKRVDPRMLELARAAKARVVWDIVDAWPQPHGNLWDRAACMRWLKGQLDSVKPHAVVAATRSMARDVVEVGFTGPVCPLPHHARPGLERNPIRRVVETVAYEGGKQYLGTWERSLERECVRRGWRFAVNPKQLAEADVVVALREMDGYAPRHWKSNVKLANAQGSGTPFVCNREAGYLETGCFGAVFADTLVELREAFDTLADATVRHHIATELRAATPWLEDVAAGYRAWLETL